VQRIPIWQDGEVIAVFGQVMFKDVRDVSRLANRLSLLESKVKIYEEELITLRSNRFSFDRIAGNSAVIRDLKKEAASAAANHFPVLITGESGTGKGLFARAIHHASPRRPHPFVRINCSAIPKDLLESELFGYERGAFTGARAEGKPGKFEMADHGTIFLDEIGDLPLEMQPKLLRVVEDKEFERVGGTRVLRSDFRVIAATNQNLEKMLSDGRFRKDLFYRLNVIPLHIPSLRERREDIIPLTRHLLGQMATEAALDDIEMGPEARKALRRYNWPGNVRELTNVLERTMASFEGHCIRLCDLPFYFQRTAAGTSRSNQASIKDVHARAEKEAIVFALKETRNNKARAARMLGIHRTHLYKKMKKHGISLDAGD
jgi:transcriptional regulator with PAS, ATPase and Fis domain